MRKTLVTTVLALAVCVPVSLRAGTFTNNFNDPNQTTGFYLYGDAAMAKDAVTGNGYLSLTPALASKNGSIVLNPPLDPPGTR